MFCLQYYDDFRKFPEFPFPSDETPDFVIIFITSFINQLNQQRQCNVKLPKGFSIESLIEKDKE